MNLSKMGQTPQADRFILLICFFILLLPPPPWMKTVYMGMYDRLLCFGTFDIILETMYIFQSTLGII